MPTRPIKARNSKTKKCRKIKGCKRSPRQYKVSVEKVKVTGCKKPQKVGIPGIPGVRLVVYLWTADSVGASGADCKLGLTSDSLATHGTV